jgi:hypothetical protein
MYGILRDSAKFHTSKKEKFHSAEGLCSKEPKAHTNNSIEFGISSALPKACV